MRIVATSLLILMAGIFALSTIYQDVHPALGYVKAFAEAAMVGGLADWFAVTALFRHPLGLPIPHTAIIPRNKDRIGDTLAAFLKDNFLIPTVVARRMQGVDIAGAAGRFLAKPEGGEGRIREGASRLIADVLASLDDERLGGVVKREIRERIDAFNIAPVLGQAMQAAMKEDKHLPLLDAVVHWTSETLDENEALIRELIHDRANRIMQWTGLDETLANAILKGFRKMLAEMAVDADHPIRLRAESALEQLAYDLQHDKKMQKRVANFKRSVMDNPAMSAWLDSLWQQGRAKMLKAARDPNSIMAGKLGDIIRQIGLALQQDGDMHRAINRFARRAVVGATARYGDGIVRLVSDTVHGWDARTITDRLEQAVGRDLQYIRINGTLVGGLVGLIIHVVEMAL